MRPLSSRPILAAFLMAASFGLGACRDGDEVDQTANGEVDANLMFEQLGNDASALEAAGSADPFQVTENDSADSAGSASEAEGNPPPSAGPGESEAPVLGETRGGDTGGNTIDGNVSGP